MARYVCALALCAATSQAFVAPSAGRWTSPVRRTTTFSTKDVSAT